MEVKEKIVAKYKSYDSFKSGIESCTIFHVKAKKDMPRDNAGLDSKLVLVDGNQYRVLGTEYFAVYIIPKGAMFGLGCIPAGTEEEDKAAKNIIKKYKKILGIK